GDGREEARGAATYDHDLAAGVTHRAMLPAYYPGRASVLPVPRFAVVGQGGSTPVAPVLRPGPGRLDDRRDAVQVRQAQRPQVALDGLEVGVDAQRVEPHRAARQEAGGSRRRTQLQLHLELARRHAGGEHHPGDAGSGVQLSEEATRVSEVVDRLAP